MKKKTKTIVTIYDHEPIRCPECGKIENKIMICKHCKHEYEDEDEDNTKWYEWIIPICISILIIIINIKINGNG